MKLMVGILRSFILLGALQGFIVSALLAFSARRDPAGTRQKRLLAILILLLAMACLNLFVFESPDLLNTPIGNVLSAVIPMVIVMPLGPLLYFYARSFLEPEFRVTRQHRRHFYSVAIDLFPHAAAVVYIILLILGVLNPHRNYGFGSFLDDYQQYADIPRWLSLSIYLWVTSQTLARARIHAKDPAALAWPRTLIRMLIAFSILWLIFLVPYELPRYSNALIDRFDWYPLYLPIVLLIYWMGVKGYFISNRAAATPVPVRTVLPAVVVEPTLLALKKAMEQDQLWLDPALNLGRLAQHCGLAPKTLSAVLNQHLEKTFNEWINEYRITAFKDRLLQPESRRLTIAGLAYDCGFNSLPTFQRAFKSFTGVTPKEYLQKSTLSLEKD